MLALLCVRFLCKGPLHSIYSVSLHGPVGYPLYLVIHEVVAEALRPPLFFCFNALFIRVWIRSLLVKSCSSVGLCCPCL